MAATKAATKAARAEAAQVAEQHSIFVRRQALEQDTCAAKLGVDELFGEEEDAAAIGDPERDPDAALLLYHQLNGHQISYNASHPPAAGAGADVFESWRRSTIEDIQKYVSVTPMQQAEIMRKFQHAVSATAPLLACASCGVRMASGYTRFDVRSLPKVFELTDAQLAERDNLGWCDLLDVRGEQPHPRIQDLEGEPLFETRSVDLRELVSCYPCMESGLPVRYHLLPNLVDVEKRPTSSPDSDPDAPPVALSSATVWLCNSRCTPVANGTKDGPPTCSLAAGVDFGQIDVLQLPDPSDIERLLLSDVRPYGTVVKLVAPSNTKESKWQHAKLKGHFVHFLHTGPTALHRVLSLSFAERKADVLRKARPKLSCILVLGLNPPPFTVTTPPRPSTHLSHPFTLSLLCLSLSENCARLADEGQHPGAQRIARRPLRTLTCLRRDVDPADGRLQFSARSRRGAGCPTPFAA